MDVAKISRTKLILLIVCFLSWQSVLQDVWQAECSLAQLTEPAERKAGEPNLVAKENRIDLEALKATDNNVKPFASGFKLESFNKISDHLVEDQEASAHAGILDSLKSFAKTTIAPVQTYTDLARRFKRWHDDYKRLQGELGTDEGGAPRLGDPLKVLRVEYAKVDNMLADEMCRNGGEAKKFENLDFIVQILSSLIDRLEMKLDEIKLNGPQSIDETANDLVASERLEEMERNANEAIQRAKRIASRSAVKFVQNELFVIVKLLAFDMAASYVANNGNVVGSDGMANLLARLEPIVLWMGSANTPILVSYLQNVKFRSIFSLVNHSFSSLRCLKASGTARQPGQQLDKPLEPLAATL